MANALLERDDEHKMVAASLDRMEATRSGSTILFRGPAGIGKTSVLNAARDQAQARGFRVLSASGRDLEQEFGWGLVRQLFEPRRHVLRTPDNESLAARKTWELITGGPVDGARARSEYELIYSLYWLTTDEAIRRPLVLVVDDLHWSDLQSLRYLAYLAARLDGVPVTLVGAFRPGAADRVSRILTIIGELSDTSLCLLRPLSTDGASGLLASFLPSAPQEGWLTAVMNATHGNPFLVKETARYVAQLDREIQAGSLPGGIPNVTEYIHIQLQRFSPEVRKAMTSLAILGDDVAAENIAVVADLTVSSTLEGLSSLLFNELVTADGLPERFSISHPLIRAAVYDSLDTAERARMHARAAQFAFRNSDLERSAAHLLRVPPGLADLDVSSILGRAADGCFARGSLEGSVAFLRRQLEEDIGPNRLAVLTRLGMAEAATNNAEATERFSEALSLDPGPEYRAEIEFGLVGATYVFSGPAAALKVCLGLLREGRTTSESHRRALHAQGLIMSKMTPVTSAQAEDLLEFSAAVGEQSERITLGAFALASAFDGDFAAAQDRARQAIVGELNLSPVAENMVAAAWATLHWCDVPEILDILDDAVAESRKDGVLSISAPAHAWRASVMLANGHVEEALADARVTWEMVTTQDSHIGAAFAGSVLAASLIERMQLAEADAVLKDARSQASMMPGYLLAEAEIVLQLVNGDFKGAYKRAQQAQHECEIVGLRCPVAVDWRTPLVECLHTFGREAEARSQAAVARAEAEHWGTGRAIGRALRTAAIVESAETQIDLLCESVQVLSETTAKLELARSQYALGDALRRNRRISEAREELQSALQLADSCGSIRLRQEVATTMRLVGARPVAVAAFGLASLTPGEVRVAKLAASGLSNREIAQILFVTTKTVEVHLSHTFRKLQITGRRGLPEVLHQPPDGGHAEGRSSAAQRL